MTLMVVTPVLAPEPLVKVSVVDPFPGAVTLVGLKLAEMPVGIPEVEKATAPLVIFTVPLALEVTVTAVALGVSDNPGTLAVIG